MILTETQKHKACAAALELKKDIEWKFLELGKQLYEIKEGRLYEAGWDSWEVFKMELKLSEATISRLFRIHEVLVLHYKIEPERLASAGGWSSVAEVLPLIDPEKTPKSEVNRLLGIVSDNPRKQARASIQEEIRGAPCHHRKSRILVLEICEDGCGERWNVTDSYKLTKA